MKKDRYIFDNSRNEFIKVSNSVWRVVGKVFKYLAVTASLAVVYYVVFSLLINTDSEKKLRRVNQMYKQQYAEMAAKQKVIDDVLKGIQIKDKKIYAQLFNSDVQSLVDFSKSMLYYSDSIPEGNIVKYTSGKFAKLKATSTQVDSNFSRIMAIITDKDRPLPPLTNPIRNFSWHRTGASVGQKINPFFKVSVEHEGMDLLTQQGDSVYAAADGVVTQVTRSEKGLGNRVEIQHQGGYSTLYAHLDGIRVSRGQRVKRGTLLGRVGMSGNSFAPHLHYEVLRDTVYQDPVNYMFGSLSADNYVNMLFLSANTGQSMD